MISDVLSCKGEKVIVADALKLKVTKDVVLAMTRYTEPVNGKPMKTTPCGYRLAKEWLRRQVLEVVNPYLDVEDAQKDEDIVSFQIDEVYGKLTVKNKVYIVSPIGSSYVGLVDRDGLHELEKDCSVERRPFLRVSLDEVCKLDGVGFLDAEINIDKKEYLENREKLGCFIGETMEKTNSKKDAVVIQDLFEAFCNSTKLAIDKVEFYNLLVDIFGDGIFAIVENKKCILQYRWKNNEA